MIRTLARSFEIAGLEHESILNISGYRYRIVDIFLREFRDKMVPGASELVEKG